MVIKKSPEVSGDFGWLTGFEPATLGSTNQYSNQLSYSHRLFYLKRVQIYLKLMSCKIFLEKYYFYQISQVLETWEILFKKL